MKLDANNQLIREEGETFNFRFDASPNVSPKPQLPERTLVIHAPFIRSVAGAVAQYQQKPTKINPFGSSVHLIVGADGHDIIQMVPFNAGAMHSFGYNGRSIAVQLQYSGEQVPPALNAMPKSKYILASGLSSSRYGYWPLYPQVQLDALLSIAQLLVKSYNIRDVQAYDEITNAMHPGPAFPILHFREKLLGITDRSFLLQEMASSVCLLGQPGDNNSQLSQIQIPVATPVAVMNEKDNWYLIAVIAEVAGNPWLMGWVEKSAVRVKTDFMPLVRQDHYLTTEDGRRFPEIPPHPNGYEALKRNPEPKYIIMHFTTGTKMESTISHFKDPTSLVSTHLLIGRDGRVIQFLPFDRIAHHAGFSWWERESNLNKYSVGIELDNAGLLRKRFDAAGRRIWMSRKLVIPDEHVQQAVHWKQFTPTNQVDYPGWEMFTDVQRQVALNIVKALVKRYPSIREILGHEDVNLINRYDPGPLFPLKEFRLELFGRTEPNVEVFTINQETVLYSNFDGRLPNLAQKLHVPSFLPEDSVVSVLKTDTYWSQVKVVQSKEPRLRGELGWIRTNAISMLFESSGPQKEKKNKKAGHGKAGQKMATKKEHTVTRSTTVGRQQFFTLAGVDQPTPLLPEGKFPQNTRVRIQTIRGEWTLVVVLDTVKGRTGQEGWIRTEMLSPEVIS